MNRSGAVDVCGGAVGGGGARTVVVHLESEQRVGAVAQQSRVAAQLQRAAAVPQRLRVQLLLYSQDVLE